MKEAGLVLLGYVLGSAPWAYWLPKALLGVDVRKVGSGNIGATNVWRNVGFKLGLAVMLLDIAKGLVPALLARWLADDVVAVLAGLAATAGHYRPLFLRFARGGKTVATTGGVMLALAPLAFLAATTVWIVAFLATRYASVGSLAAGATLPLFALAFGASWPVVGFACAAAAAIVVLHKGNIRRLFAGTESKMQLRRRRPPGADVTGRSAASL